MIRFFIRVFRAILVLIIAVYQKCISPILPASCIYEPTCSGYMKQAIQAHGIIRGLWMGTKRICRCHPFADGGYDPVPDRKCKDCK